MCPTRAQRRLRPTFAAGQIPVGFRASGPSQRLVRGGQVKLIGVTTQNRAAAISRCATVSESGLPGSSLIPGSLMLAPAGTPKHIIARLNAEVLKAVGDPEIRRKLEELGFAVRGSSAEELRVMTRDQLAKYARVIKRWVSPTNEMPVLDQRQGVCPLVPSAAMCRRPSRP